MPLDPYANVKAPMAPKAPPPPKMGVSPRTPQELDQMLMGGFTVNPDGSLSPPAVPMPPPQFTASPMPSAGAMRMAGQPAAQLPPPPPSEPEAFLSDPIFAQHMGIRTPQPEKMGPIEQMMAPATEPPPPVNIGVPGGASIQNGMPVVPAHAGSPSAKQPTPPAYKPTYNVTMPTSEEASQRQYMTEVQRGQNHQNRRDYDEMVHQRKVKNLRGVLGRS